MSHVADIILTTPIEDGGKKDGDSPNVDVLINYLRVEYHLEERPKSPLEKVDGHAGGDKAMQCDVFIGAINYLDINGFIEVFKSIKWEYPEDIQLLIKDEHDDKFKLYEIAI